MALTVCGLASFGYGATVIFRAPASNDLQTGVGRLALARGFAVRIYAAIALAGVFRRAYGIAAEKGFVLELACAGWQGMQVLAAIQGGRVEHL